MIQGAQRISPGQALAAACAVPPGMVEISSRAPLSATVGASVAVCLIDRDSGTVGLRQLILPADIRHRRHDAMLKADAALEDLCCKLCAEIGAPASARGIKRLRAKIAGGAERGASGLSSANGQRTVLFITSWLRARNIPVAAQNIGGSARRQLIVLPGCGTLLCRQSELTADFLLDEFHRLTQAPESHHHIELF